MSDGCDFPRFLTGHRLRPTALRLLVLEVLGSAERAFTAREILEAVRRRRRVNKVSVYRILEDFSRLGLVRQVPVTGGSAHYELACEHHPPHPHFQCRECGDLECLEPVSLEQVRREIEGVLGRRAEGLEVRVAGVCRRCGEAG